MSSDNEPKQVVQVRRSLGSDTGTTAAIGAGVVTGLTAGGATNYVLGKKLFDIDNSIINKAADEIKTLNFGAGMAGGGGALSEGGHVAGGIFTERAYRNALKDSKLAKELSFLGGRGGVSMAVGVVTGLLAFGATALAFGMGKKKKPVADFSKTQILPEMLLVNKTVAEDKETKDLLTKALETNDPEERKKLKEGWEAKMAERKAASGNRAIE